MLANLISSAIATKIQQKYSLDNGEYLALMAIIGGLTSYAMTVDMFQVLAILREYMLWPILIAILFAGAWVYKTYKLKPKKIVFEYVSASDITSAIIEDIIKTNRKSIGFTHINTFTFNRDPCIIRLFNDDIIVNDDENDLHGIIRYTTQHITIPKKTEGNERINCLEVVISYITKEYNHDLPFRRYINSIRNTKYMLSSSVKLKYAKIFSHRIVGNVYFDHAKTEYPAIMKHNINTYFNNNSKILERTIETQSYHVKNFILYGEPGTGKSKFISLFAQAVQATIISINLVDFAECKSNLYKLFNMELCNTPAFPDKSFDDNDASFIANEFYGSVCIVLEEVDYALEKLLEIQEARNNPTTVICDKDIKIDIPVKQPSNDSLEVSDLLELFQGLVEYKNRYIFATTNNFEKINTIIPALFRAGRMTPIYITHMTWEDLTKCVKYYYSEDVLTILPMPIKKSSSSIVQFVELQAMDGVPFDTFCNGLSKFLTS